MPRPRPTTPYHAACLICPMLRPRPPRPQHAPRIGHPITALRPRAAWTGPAAGPERRTRHGPAGGGAGRLRAERAAFDLAQPAARRPDPDSSS